MAPAYRHTSGRSFVLSIFCLQAICIHITSECDQTFVSRQGGPLNGTFHAPEYLNPKGHSRQCVYIFVAGPGHRVEVVFTSFKLRGAPPDGAAGEIPPCIHEYMDVYSEVVQPDPAELINSPFGGRYCGPISPRRRISLYRAIALSFYSDKNNSTPDLFTGRYSFINDSEYEVGVPVANTPCSFLIKGAVKPTGLIMSPTYPGAYPKDITCTYQFLGTPGQRVRLEFRDFDLFFGGPHCPFDYVKLYDGPDNTSAVIGTYCGQQRNLVLYSSEASLFISFVTLSRTANTQNRGFKGMFEFSNSFTKLDFISKNDGEHIRGSECDQKILSKKESSGFVFSPNYPFPYMPKLVCRYFIYGMQDAQHLERVRLEFVLFEIPKGPKEDCSDGYLKVYLKGQETTDSYDKFDHEMCGDETKPQVVVSDGPRLVMVFSSGELMGRGFKANYTFETEYRIPGTPAPDGSCTFTYRSSSKKKGEFNSPRYPSNYPSDTNCTYLFLSTPNEQVSIVFDNFKVRADAANGTFGSYGVNVCEEDWLEIYNTYRDGTEKAIGRYCGMTAPGPIESNRGAIGLKIVLHANSEGVYSGFKARYTFETAKSIFGDCGGNMSSLEYGVISSPNFPSNYDGPSRGQASKICNWYVTVKPKCKILINFERFAVEGDPESRGCPAAVLRLWLNLSETPKEMCGEKRPASKWEYLSHSNAIRLSFITADKAVGSQGFRAVWTEVEETDDCTEFQCAKSGHCIPKKLKCNLVNNCGADDDSDEADCGSRAPFVIATPLQLLPPLCLVALLLA
ncbi:dorsal-ventral patterning tolloid-like protein 1 isoform X3 [Photinus pyralis]|uniref:dorsal-ventral patterning tolloid-like protein 1 isoform X3 n=1 Tax=Photinus pyralis TaxID=7054 RepID=UPI0012671910|nr:dorsal-ventral patterning tolloid-like protein 1 isoform X3 [Photinus pyralis]